MNRTSWTSEEIEILKREWPKAGYAGVRDLLPHRTLNQLRGAAYRYQIHVENRSYVQQPATEWIDAAIVRTYRLSPKTPNLKALAKSLNRTYGWVKWRAQTLGVVRAGIGAIGKPNVTWTPEENELLERCVEQGLKVNGIQSRMKRQGYYRSISSIIEKISSLGMQIERTWWNCRETAQALNVDNSVVNTWIQRGWLKAKKQHAPTSKLQNDPYWWSIDRKDLRLFLITYPRAWDHRRVRMEMLLEILCFDKTPHGLGKFKATEITETA